MFQRIDQEYASNIHSVDVVNTADQAHVHRFGIETAGSRNICPKTSSSITTRNYYDPEGFSLVTRVLVSPFGINTTW